ncbi:MAG TPA: nucleotidyltransferase family protein [Pirellulales bacterium]
MSIAAIILAAGRSRRMGTQKLLLPWDGKTIIEYIVDQISAAGLNPIVVVIGGDAAADTSAITQVLASRQVVLVHNPDRDAEMLTSVRCGLSALPTDCHAALIALGDQPTIRTGLIQQLVEAYESSGHGIVMPAFLGKRGHPTILSAGYFREVLTQYDGVGLRGLLDAHPKDVHEFSVSNPDVLADMDYPDEYQSQKLAHDTTRETSD